jgi:YVTN family beta-propeller protein
MSRIVVVGLVMLIGCAMRSGPTPTAPPLPASAIVATIPVGTPPTLLAMSSDGARVFAASSGKLTIIRTSDDQVQTTVPIAAYTSGVAVTLDGKRVLVDNVTGVSLAVVDAATGAVQKPIPLIIEIHPGGFERIAVAPDGRRAIVANQRKEYLAVADLSGAPARESLLDMRPSDVTFSPDGRSLFVTGCRDFCTTGTVEVLDAATLQTVRSFDVGPSPYRFAFSADGARAYTTNLTAPSVSIVDVAAGTLVGTVPVGVEPTGLAVSPDGARVYVASQMARTLTVIDARTGTVAKTLATPTRPREVVVSPDGRRVYLSTQDSVLVLDPQRL